MIYVGGGRRGERGGAGWGEGGSVTQDRFIKYVEEHENNNTPTHKKTRATTQTKQNKQIRQFIIVFWYRKPESIPGSMYTCL